VRILVTNDDGIDSVGLHHLARAMTGFGEVVVVAPDREFSGASAAIGALHLFEPEVVRRRIDGVPEAWSVNGPPALCVMYSWFGIFGEPFDLVVSGINPGANVGRSVYYSGTVGACLSARNGATTGVAVSQAVTGWGVEGQAWDDIVANQKWEVAAEVARIFVQGLVEQPPAGPLVANLNVPNCELDEIRGWRLAEVGLKPPRTMQSGRLVPTDDPDRFGIETDWGEYTERPAHTDVGAIERGYVTVSYLSRLENEARYDVDAAESALTGLLDGD
jgi:5'-nucleotidase